MDKNIDSSLTSKMSHEGIGPQSGSAATGTSPDIGSGDLLGSFCISQGDRRWESPKFTLKGLLWSAKKYKFWPEKDIQDIIDGKTNELIISPLCSVYLHQPLEEGAAAFDWPRLPISPETQVDTNHVHSDK